MTWKYWTRREALLTLAQDLGIAVLIIRPCQSGRLFRAVSGRELPVLGIGTNDVFDHASTPEAIARNQEIVEFMSQL